MLIIKKKLEVLGLFQSINGFPTSWQIDHKQYGWTNTIPHSQHCSPPKVVFWTPCTFNSTFLPPLSNLLISYNDYTACLEEIKIMEILHQKNNHLLNVSKTKELIVDYSTKQESNYQSHTMNMELKLVLFPIPQTNFFTAHFAKCNKNCTHNVHTLHFLTML